MHPIAVDIRPRQFTTRVSLRAAWRVAPALFLWSRSMQDIVCTVCGRRTPLAPGSTMACPSCGAPLAAPALPSAEDDSATRPSIPPMDAAPRDIAEVTTNVTPPANLLDDGDTTNVTKTADDVTADFPMAPAPPRTQTIPAQAMPSTESQTQPALP